MITVAEAARRLDAAPSVVYRMIHTGQLAAYRKPGRATYLIDEADVEQAKVPVPIAPPNVSDDNRALSAIEVAAILRCSPKTVRALVADGALVAQRNPGYRSHLRILATSVEAYLTQRRAS